MAAMEMFEEHEGTHILQSLDGFAISLNSDGRFLYISETVSIYLGLSQVSKFSYRDVIYRWYDRKLHIIKQQILGIGEFKVDK